MRLNNICSLCGDRDETINHIIRECSKLGEKYKTRHHCVGKVIHRELCKKFKSDPPTKWYMQNPESLLKGEMHKVHWDFEKPTGHLIPTRRPNIFNKKKKACCIVDFVVLANHRWKIKVNEKRNKYLDLTWEQKKLWNVKLTMIPLVIGALRKRAKRVENRKTNRDHPNNSIIEIGQNTKKSPRDLRKR